MSQVYKGYNTKLYVLAFIHYVIRIYFLKAHVLHANDKIAYTGEHREQAYYNILKRYVHDVCKFISNILSDSMW